MAVTDEDWCPICGVPAGEAEPVEYMGPSEYCEECRFVLDGYRNERVKPGEEE